jgi:hypothetical protein
MEVFDNYHEILQEGIAMGYHEPFESIVDLAGELEQYVDETLFEDANADTLLGSYAQAFVSQVNFYEIAETMAGDFPELVLEAKDEG